MEHVSEKTFLDLVSALKDRLTEDQSVSLAVGSFYDDGTVDLSEAMHVADERMYNDKLHYYENHPRR